MRRKLIAAMVAGLFSGMALAAGATAQQQTAWTGLVYSPNKPEPGTAARALADGKDYLRNDMPANAEEFFRRAVAMDPDLAEAHFWLAGALRKLKKPGAQDALAMALRLDPSLGAHVGELQRFGPPVAAKASKPRTGKGKCDDLYATCIVSANHCTAAGCTYDAGRAATCMGERNQCYGRN